MNQIQAPPYQQPSSFGPSRGLYHPQQPLYAPHQPHPLSFSTTQSQLDSNPSNPQASSPPPAQASPLSHSSQLPSGNGVDGSLSHFAAQVAQSSGSPSHAGSQQQQRYPMAAPPRPSSVQRQQSPASATVTSQPGSPTTSAKSLLDRKRSALLLDINLALLENMNQLQADGHGGAMTPQQAALLRSQGQPDKRCSDEYVQSYLRLQANLGWLYSLPDMQALNPQRQDQPPNNKGPAHPPNFMQHPAHLPALEERYSALRQLFPGWTGKDATKSPGGSAPPPSS